MTTAINCRRINAAPLLRNARPTRQAVSHCDAARFGRYNPVGLKHAAQQGGRMLAHSLLANRDWRSWRGEEEALVAGNNDSDDE